jgi:hypothetical protein
MDNKKWYESKTIQSAIAACLITLSSTILDIYKKGDITESQVALIVGAVITLYKTVEGRSEAEGPLATPRYLPGLNETPKDRPGAIEIQSLDVGTYINSAEEIEKELTIKPEDPDNLVTDTSSEIESSEGEIDFFEYIKDSQGKYKIIPVVDTTIKTEDKDSSVLSSDKTQTLKEDCNYFITSYRKESINSLSVTLEGQDSKFYLFIPHIKLFNSKGKEIDLSSNSDIIVNPRKTPFRLPGYNSTFYLEDSIIPNGHFSWSEATKGGTRLPVNKDVADNIISMSKDLESIREYFGNRPMRITSWYRDPLSNKAVGGASNSSHLTGRAVDLYIPGLDIFEVENKLVQWWRKGGIGRGAKKGFVHVANDNWFRVWNY